MNTKQQILKNLPSVDKVLEHDILRHWSSGPETTKAVRIILNNIRDRILSNDNDIEPPDVKSVAEQTLGYLEKKFAARLVKVLNGTGIIVHTNLGRSPLSDEAIDAVVRHAKGYSSLEFNLENGKRGSRHSLVHHLLTSLTGAEDALVTNNNAAAIMLALASLSKRKEVVVSRGQLVEIGGSFRIPEVCKAGGAKLKEVGTTNRTRLSDYENAINPSSGLFLQVHCSNYRVIGFTEEVVLKDLVELGKKYEIPVVSDLGSGALVNPGKLTSLAGEPTISDVVKTGVSVVTFSGDKLLGGPQSGIAVGKKQYIEKMRRNPLMRAVRPDKLTFAALDATLRGYLTPGKVPQNIPVWKMLTMPLHELEKRAEIVLDRVKKTFNNSELQLKVAVSDSYTGGGSLPTERLESRAICFTGPGRKLSALQKHLRSGNPPLIGYLKDNCFWIDQRTLLLEEIDDIVNVINKAGKQVKEDR